MTKTVKITLPKKTIIVKPNTTTKKKRRGWNVA